MELTQHASRVAARRPPARSWLHACAIAALVVYVPQLLPLLVTDIVGHDHCMGIYLRHFPIFVGFLPGLHAQFASNLGDGGEELVFYGASILVTLAVLAVTATTLRRWRWAGLGAAVAAGLLSAWLSIGAVVILRS